MNAEGKGSPHMGKVRVVEVGRKRQHKDFSGSLKEQKKQEEGKMLEQWKIYMRRFRKKHESCCGKKGYEARTVHILHRAPRTVLTYEIATPKMYPHCSLSFCSLPFMCAMP